MEWIKVENRIPKIGKSVLIFYTIPETDKHRNKTGNNHEYLEIACVQSITRYASSGNKRIVEWITSDYQPVIPTHWMPLPEPPKP